MPTEAYRSKPPTSMIVCSKIFFCTRIVGWQFFLSCGECLRYMIIPTISDKKQIHFTSYVHMYVMNVKVEHFFFFLIDREPRIIGGLNNLNVVLVLVN